MGVVHANGAGPGVPPIDIAIETAADPATAWQAVTLPERIALWFTEATPLGAVGERYRLDFGEGSVVVGEVVALEPGRRFGYTWAWEDADASDATSVEWTVEPLPGGGSRVRLVHSGWHGGEGTARDDHEGYWRGYLDDLRDILEEA